MISSRVSFWIALALLLLAAWLRMVEFVNLPLGLHDGEITDIRVVEAVRGGNVSVFYDVGGDGRDSLFPVITAAATTLTGTGSLGYRLVALWAGMLLPALVFALGRRLADPVAGLSALALAAFGFWPVLLSRMAIHEALLPGLVAVILLSLAVALPTYPKYPSERGLSAAFVAVGVFLGLALYTHPVGIVLVLMAMAFIVYIVRSPQPLSRRRQSYTSFALLLALTLAIPYVTSSVRLPEISGATRLVAQLQGFSIGDVVDKLIGLAFVGDADPTYNLPGRPLFDPVSVVFMGLGLYAAWRRRQQPGYALVLIALAFLGPAALLNARDSMFPALTPLLPVLVILFGLGVSAALNRLPRLGRVTVAVGLVALLGFNLWWSANTLFNRWGDLPGVQQAYHSRLGALASFADRNSPYTPTVICGWNAQQSPSAEMLSDAQMMDLMMNRADAPVRYVDCATGLVMTDGGARQYILLPDPNILETAHPQVRRWFQQGALLRDPALPPESVLVLDIVDPLADALGVFTVTTPIRFAPEVGGGDPFGPPVRFGGNLTLLGYVPELLGGYAPGDVLVLPTYWRADGIVPPDLRLFTHLLADPGAAPAANTDTISVLPAGLRDRDVFLQVTAVRLPESLPPGVYSISVGAYQETSSARLYVLDGDAPRGDRLFLYQIRVDAPGSPG